MFACVLPIFLQFAGGHAYHHSLVVGEQCKTEPYTQNLLHQERKMHMNINRDAFDHDKEQNLQFRGAVSCFSRLSVLVAHDCGYPLSRYTCRAIRVAADFLDFIAFCRCSTGVALHSLKILVSHLPPPLCREVSHRNLGV